MHNGPADRSGVGWERTKWHRKCAACVLQAVYLAASGHFEAIETGREDTSFQCAAIPNLHSLFNSIYRNSILCLCVSNQ